MYAVHSRTLRVPEAKFASPVRIKRIMDEIARGPRARDFPEVRSTECYARIHTACFYTLYIYIDNITGTERERDRVRKTNGMLGVRKCPTPEDQNPVTGPPGELAGIAKFDIRDL